MNILKIRNKLRYSSTASKVFFASFLLSCVLSATSGFLYYSHVQKTLLQGLQDQASLLCNTARNEFISRYSDVIERQLYLLASSSQLDGYLMSSQNERIVARAEIEKTFLPISRSSKDILLISFIDSSGSEVAAVAGRKRLCDRRTLAQIDENDIVGKQMLGLFRHLSVNDLSLYACTAPFRDNNNRPGFLVALRKQEPEAGGFGGIIIQHYDLSDYIHDIGEYKLYDTPIVWIYGQNGSNLLSPPKEYVQLNPSPFLLSRTDIRRVGRIYTVQCEVFENTEPLVTVVCSIPPQLISSKLRAVVLSVAAMFSVMIIASFGLSVLISNWISNPIKRLTYATENISADKIVLDLPELLIKSKGEIGTLARTLAKMLRNLNQEVAVRKKTENALQNSEKRFEEAANNAGDWIWEVNAEGLYTYSSTIVERLLGYKPDELVGKKYFYEFFIPDVRDELKDAAFEAFNRRESFKGFVNPNVHKDGNIVIMETNGTPIIDENGDFRGYRGADRDVTERQKTENAMKSLNEELGSTIDKLTATNRELSEFVHIASHDLKAPLRAIGSLAGIIAVDYGDKMDERGRQYLNILTKRTERISELIGGILRYAELGRDVREQAVDINKVIEQAIAKITPPGDIKIIIENNLPTVMCGRLHMLQVFQNLLSNAIKYMDKPEGCVTIGCVEADNYWRFSVADNGCGIEEKYFEKIFQIFQTLTRRDEIENTGVGLSIVRRIIEKYNGTIWVESEPGVGSTFFFTLPKQEAEVQNEKFETNTVS